MFFVVMVTDTVTLTWWWISYWKAKSIHFPCRAAIQTWPHLRSYLVGMMKYYFSGNLLHAEETCEVWMTVFAHKPTGLWLYVPAATRRCAHNVAGMVNASLLLLLPSMPHAFVMQASQDYIATSTRWSHTLILYMEAFFLRIYFIFSYYRRWVACM